MLKWHGEEFLRKTKEEQLRRLKRATIFLNTEVKRALGEDKSPPPSEPGEIPHLEKGELRRSITWEVDEAAMIGRVGTNKIYGKYLELGTKRMAKRPFLRPTLVRCQAKIANLLTGK
jgi:hypothetical protein